MGRCAFQMASVAGPAWRQQGRGASKGGSEGGVRVRRVGGGGGRGMRGFVRRGWPQLPARLGGSRIRTEAGRGYTGWGSRKGRGSWGAARGGKTNFIFSCFLLASAVFADHNR